jgi:hypothetical protein
MAKLAICREMRDAHKMRVIMRQMEEMEHEEEASSAAGAGSGMEMSKLVRDAFNTGKCQRGQVATYFPTFFFEPVCLFAWVGDLASVERVVPAASAAAKTKDS